MNAPIDVTNIRIETQRLILRPWQMEDLETFYLHSFDDEDDAGDSLDHPPIAVFRGILNNIIQECKSFAIVLKENEAVIGSLGLQPRHDDTGFPDDLDGREISYELFKSYRGNGYMTEAVNAVCRYCFDRLHYDYLTCGHFDHNHRSRRVAEKCGFVFLKNVITPTAAGVDEPGKLYVLYNPNK